MFKCEGIRTGINDYEYISEKRIVPNFFQICLEHPVMKNYNHGHESS